MPGLARKSGWNAVRTEPFDSRCLTLVVQSVDTVELQKVHLYSRAARRQTGAGAGPLPAQAHISGQRWRPRPKTGRARADLDDADQPTQTAGARCRRRRCPRPHQGPACSLLVHTHCPDVCTALAMQQCVQRRLRP